MRSPGRCAALLTAVLLTGCGGSPAPGPSASPAPPPCTPDTGTIAWDAPASTPTLLQVVARFLNDDLTTWRDLVDRPITPEVTGDGTDRTWIPTLARSLGEHLNLSLGAASSPDSELESLRTMLEGSTQKGWVLGYSGTSVVKAGFRVTCGGGSTPVAGTLTTWNSIDAGFLSCDDTAARDQPSDYGEVWTYCPTD
ncbi:hypothetical protein [Catenuloplanes japonicus]|uniref:hypothetical protein n=1 Tax=Catenuloplanes japonicus TaxID=33876 RepID=UPI0012FC182B|nr:hypothetical protein [Catenuloplanes japonicus]